jgi:aryl-alcohol dehydrogenase-like predicted oxidoreductase
MGRLSVSSLRRTQPLIDVLRLVARAHDATPGQVALAWETTFHGDTVVAIPGATRPSQAEQSAAAMGITLSAQELTRIDEASRSIPRR